MSRGGLKRPTLGKIMASPSPAVFPRQNDIKKSKVNFMEGSTKVVKLLIASLSEAQAELARVLTDLWRDSPEELEVEDCVLSMDYVWHVLDPPCSEYGIKVDRCSTVIPFLSQGDTLCCQRVPGHSRYRHVSKAREGGVDEARVKQ
ncbi:hypothetical protein ARMGADRAFT_1022698 [Armillaria gallica]|uniref:Uncharacterized protein n=1 Tax=Armillaria gallica TaxID=47427 RepID=A0A2H3ENZ1_ARMGA|nr:hypothetical protein ARMGADRAFT_1022698 [Armillaria gallica]